MGVIMALAAAAVLAHLVATGARARRRDLAVARAIGLTPRQVRQVVRWQGATLALVSAVFGGAFGVVGGRFAWRRYAESLGVVPEPVTPWLLIMATATGVLTAGVVVSFVPGWWAARCGRVRS